MCFGFKHLIPDHLKLWEKKMLYKLDMLTDNCKLWMNLFVFLFFVLNTTLCHTKSKSTDHCISQETKQNEGEGLAGSLKSSTSYPAEGPSVRFPSAELPKMPFSLSQMEETTPEMPRLQSFFSSTLPCVSTCPSV